VESAPDRRIWVDGELVPWEAATVHVLSHSLQRGSLVFDYMSVHDTARGAAVFRLREHAERFLRSVELVGLPLAQSAAEVEGAVIETVRANPGCKAVKTSAYLAAVEVDVVPMDPRVTLAIAAYDPFADIIERNPGKLHASPTLSIWIEKEKHNRRKDILPPQAKVAANYASPMAAKWAARKAGYDEILLVDEFGYVAEGPTTNVFMVDAEGAVLTPLTDRVLLGVTRSAVLEIAKHDGFEVREAGIRPDELMAAAEVFLTGTTAGVLAVESIDGQAVGTGVPGPVSAALREHFVRIISGEDEDFAHWLTYVNGGREA
jgi:branched-chain amino acid aminotransferase